MDETTKHTTITDEMGWILKVLLSCKNESHLKVSDNLFDNFIKKWDIGPNSGKEGFTNSYNKIKFIAEKRIK